MDFICGLDIDKDKIVGILAKIDRQKNILDIYIEKGTCQGFSKGRVVDLVFFSESISKVINDLEAKSGISIRNVFVNVKGDFIKTIKNTAALPLSESLNRVIRLVDVKRVNKFAHDLALDINEEAIFEVPHKYKIDDHDNIDVAVGLSGHKIETDLFLIKANFTYLEPTRQALRHIGINTSGFILSGLATASVVLDRKDKISGAVLIDISNDITEILVFSTDKLVNYKTLSFGYSVIDQAVSFKLGVPLDVATQINNSYAVINMPSNLKDEEIVIKRDSEYITLNKSMVSSVITEETRNMLNSIKNELSAMQINCNNIFITGEISLIEGFIELAETILEKPLKLGRVKDVHLVPYFESIWAVRALGLIKYSMDNSIVLERKDSGNFFSDLVLKAREIYQDYF